MTWAAAFADAGVADVRGGVDQGLGMSLTAGRARSSGHYLRKRLRSTSWSQAGALFSALLLVVSIIVYRLGGIDFAALKALFFTVLGLAALSLLLALAGLWRVWRRGHEGSGPAIGAVFVALLVLLPYGIAAYLAAEYPQTNTAETDGMLASDIVAGASLTEALSADQSAESRPRVSSRRFEARAAQVYAVARTIMSGESWVLVDVATGQPVEPVQETGDLGVSGTVEIPVPTARASVDLAAAIDPFRRPDAEEYTLTAVATTWILALRSDVTLRIVEEGTETFVDLRSTSRTVAWDLGQNRRFIESFLSALDEAMRGIASVVPPAEDG